MAESAIQAIVGKLVVYSADAIKNQVSYLCCYSCNFQTLVDEVGELNIRHESVQQDVDAARANFGVITPEVEAWLRKVEDLKTRSDKIRGDAEEVKRSSVCKWFPVLYYSLSRKALKTAKDSIELRNVKFDKIFNPVIPADVPPIPTTSIVSFKSRDSIEDRIMDALKDPNVYSIGIWGIPGVGKTVMAKKIEEKVRDEKYLFLIERVVMIVVSQQPDLSKIQSQIASELGLILDSEESPISRQRKIHHRLMAEKGILIILDDLWERLDLEEFGIPPQSTHAGCKLILISRNQDALTSTGVLVQNIFQLKILTEEESWRFFKDKADIKVDDSHDELVQIAKKVERECMGLPLALKIVACALKDKGISFWNNAVRELKKHIPDNIPGVTKGVYGSLLFSIKALEGKEQKDLFLLCCLFPEDYFISIEELSRCVIGLGIFKELKNLTEVRDKVETVLNILLSRSLLIEGDEERENFNVRMHDVIRDVGIWIANKGIEKHMFLIKHGVNEWPTTEDDSSNNYTCISLLFSHHSISFPKSIVCPKLEFLRLDFIEKRLRNYYVELPENFLSRMGGLRVLEASHIQLLPPSMGQLNNLRALSLEQCRIFETISVLGKLINLEMLSLRICEFELLPMEIGGLKKLKQMNILHCPYLSRIAFGVVSGLSRLEELVILDSFNNWMAEVGGEEDIACLSELNNLENLTTLKIEIWNPSVVPRQKPLWAQKVKKYGIIVSGFKYYPEKVRFQKSIILGRSVINSLGDWIYDMASDAEYVNLEGSNCMKFAKRLYENSWNLRCLKLLRLSDFNNIQYLPQGLQNGAIFPMLESLHIEDSVSLQQISEVSPPTGSFVSLRSINLFELSGLVRLWKLSIEEQFYLGNLKYVEIDGCDSLSYLFSLSVTQSLVQLTNLRVRNCLTIEEIFKREDGELAEIDKVILPKLREIEFSSLDSFYRLCHEIDRIELPELCLLNLYELPRMTMAQGDNNEVHQKYLIPKVAGISSSFCKLQHLEVKSIENFKCMFSPSVIFSGLLNLWWLKVEDCSMLEQIMGKDDEEVGRAIIFPNLKELRLCDLPNIHTFCYNIIQFPSLEQLHVSKCPLMLKFVEELNDRISSSKPFLDEQVQCPKLKRLELNKLNISTAFSPHFFKSLIVLEDLYLSYCDRLEHMITKEEGQIVTNTEEEFIKRIPLKNFHLFKLPKLYGSVFCMKHNLEFPLLKSIEIEDCLMLEKFSHGSLHLPSLTRVKGLLDAEFAANFFFHKEVSFGKIYSENNCFIISIKDISFNFDHSIENGSRFLAPNSSERFLDAVKISFSQVEEIVGKFKIEKIRTGIEYEIMLMIMFLNGYGWEDSIVIELKLPEGSRLKLTEILGNHQIDTWIEISIGKFVIESQQSEQFEFSLYLLSRIRQKNRRLCVKGIRLVEV